MSNRFGPRTRTLGAVAPALVMNWLRRPLGTVIKSIQPGVVTIANGQPSGTATLGTAVVVANTILLWDGGTSNNAASLSSLDDYAQITLTNTTTVTATRQGTALVITARFTAIEFQPGVLKSCQYRSIPVNGALSGTQTITAVVVANSVVLPLGRTSNRAAASACTASETELDLVLTNTTTVTASHVTAAGNWTVGCVVAEFF